VTLVGVQWLLVRRLRSSTEPTRRMLAPVLAASILYATALAVVLVRSAVNRLVTALPGLHDNAEIRDAVATAFRDDSLQIFFWRGHDGHYIDSAGAPVKLPQGEGPLMVTKLAGRGEPIPDRRVPRPGMIWAWLRAGVVEDGRLHRTEQGTPQGGVVSPVLMNIALHGMASTSAVTVTSH
jgi:hypothetical protein